MPYFSCHKFQRTKNKHDAVEVLKIALTEAAITMSCVISVPIILRRLGHGACHYYRPDLFCRAPGSFRQRFLMLARYPFRGFHR